MQSAKLMKYTRRKLLTLLLPFTLPFIRAEGITLPRVLEDLIGPKVLRKIGERPPLINAVGRLSLSSGARADLTKFLLADEIEMPVRMPTKLDKDIVFLLFTYSELPQNLTVSMHFGPAGYRDDWRLMKKSYG